MVKAIAGGGGLGLRIVKDLAGLPAAFERCRSEALKAFGTSAVFFEQWLPHVRHIEIQVVGDGKHSVALGERECSLQRRHQKLVEVAPSPTLDAALREELAAAALRMADAVGYRGLGTFEFLVDVQDRPVPFAFLEVNPRLQVEHTVASATPEYPDRARGEASSFSKNSLPRPVRIHAAYRVIARARKLLRFPTDATCDARTS
jgi:acetyl/propionyl-CoA carboxylase alpha subunit